MVDNFASTDHRSIWAQFGHMIQYLQARYMDSDGTHISCLQMEAGIHMCNPCQCPSVCLDMHLGYCMDCPNMELQEQKFVL